MYKVLWRYTVAFFILFSLVSCNIKKNTEVDNIKIGVTSIPHSEILNNIKDTFEMDFEVITYMDYSKLNEDLLNDKIQCNFFQTREYLNNFNLNNGNKLVEVSKVHVEPLMIYSKKYKSIESIKDGGILYIPDDIINRNRALNLLKDAGLITLSEETSNGVYNIILNPKNLVINEVPINDIPKLYNDSDLIIVNTNVALEHNIDPKRDGIFYENSFMDENKFNVFVTREELKDSNEIIKISKYLNDYSTYKFIMDRYNGFIKPVF